jgi:uncharacterized OB-fold protein
VKGTDNVAETPTADASPIVPFIEIPPNGPPYLVGIKCSGCRAVFTGEPRRACAACGAREGLTKIKLSDKGNLYNYTIVWRSYPGIQVPFVSAIVDLEGGGSLKGTLLHVDPAHDSLKFDMPVNVVIRAVGRQDGAGGSNLSYFFVPA